MKLLCHETPTVDKGLLFEGERGETKEKNGGRSRWHRYLPLVDFHLKLCPTGWGEKHLKGRESGHGEDPPLGCSSV